jgi:ABC-type lipoprotein export system ATPase subunit
VNHLSELPLSELLTKYPYVRDFFGSIGLGVSETKQPFRIWLNHLADEAVFDAGMDREQILSHINRLVTEVQTLQSARLRPIRSLTIRGGRNKEGRAENVCVQANAGQVVCIVGPTGSGKSRLLADIECLAQNDTPTGRTVLIDGEIPSSDTRFCLDQKPVAQLSQNMNFVVDLRVREFISMHAQCRMVTDVSAQTERVIACANRLTGESFSADVSVTQLSGGQARALMIADAALLSASPIVLIDEIENAGVDRKQALELLVTGNKIVFISTHDPLLALRGQLRIAVRNGGIADVLVTSNAERRNLESIEAMDAELSKIRDRLRQGEKIEEPIEWPH